MNNLKLIVFVLIALLAGYVIGNLFPCSIIQGFNSQKNLENISGNAALSVKILDENNSPLKNIEVDVGTQPGQPPLGGSVYTNESGEANFNIKPGSYFIYFNTVTFPDKFELPESRQIIVEAGFANTATIILKNK
ncbi:MAG: hypothetical protein PHC61_16450 [Chitinivibrionales bacterium]|nr:hypothetical protein [Chitinivibrionales bacterium]